MDSNSIGVTGVANSGSATGNGIFLSCAGGGTVTLAITNNQIRRYTGNAAIYADNTGGTYDLNITLTGNLGAEGGAGAFAGLAIAAGAPTSADDIDVCAQIGGAGALANNFSAGDPSNANDIILGVSTGASSMRLRATAARASPTCRPSCSATTTWPARWSPPTSTLRRLPPTSPAAPPAPCLDLYSIRSTGNQRKKEDIWMAEPFLSEIRMMSFAFAPKGWALEQRTAAYRSTRTRRLFSLLGTTFGGDGRVNFGLPDLRGRVPIHVGSGHTLGERGGEQAHTLSIAELPTHTHVAQATSDAADTSIAANNTVLGAVNNT